MSRSRSNDSMTGRSHQSCVRCPKTTPMSRTCEMRSFQGTRPAISQRPEIGNEDAGEDLDSGGFARAIGADVTDEFSRLDAERDAVQCADGAVSSLNHAFERTPRTGLAFSDVEGFHNIRNDDVGHFGSPPRVTGCPALEKNKKPVVEITSTTGCSRQPGLACERPPYD